MGLSSASMLLISMVKSMSALLRITLIKGGSWEVKINIMKWEKASMSVAVICSTHHS